MGICFQENEGKKRDDNSNIKANDNKDDSEKEKKKDKKSKSKDKEKGKNIKDSNRSSKNSKSKKSDKDGNEEEEEEEKVLNTMSKEETKILLDSLFSTYYKAKTYFHDNEFKDKEVDAISCLRKIAEAKEMLEKGNHKIINIKKLPKKINSEYITGFTPEKRKEEINKIIERLNKEREETRAIINKKIEQYKKILVKSKDKEKDKERIKKILDHDQSQITAINKEIDEIKNKTLGSDYIPVPLIMTVNEACKKEKINDDIEQNTMEVKVSGLTYTKTNPLVVLAIRGENFSVSKEIKGKNQDELAAEFKWNFTDVQYRCLVRFKIEVALARTYTFKSTKVKGKGELQLRKLKDQSSINETVPLKMESGKPDTNIDIQVNLRAPFIEKEYEDDFREVIKIVKFYPKFQFGE